MLASFARPHGPPSPTARLVRAVLRRRVMGGNHFPTAHGWTKLPDSRTPAATARPFHLDAQRAAQARLCRGFPGLNRFRKCPADAGVLRLLDMGWTKRWIFPLGPIYHAVFEEAHVLGHKSRAP